MKHKALLFLIGIFGTLTANAHYLWIESNGNGRLGEKHEIRIHYGEYTYGVIEQVDGEAFQRVSKYTLWVISPDGTKTTLPTEAGQDHYRAYFTPAQNGVYTIALNNNEIGVVDYTQYDFGIFKTHYHATAKVVVGQADADTQTANPSGIAVKQVVKEGHEIVLQVLYKDEPLTNNELKVYVSDLWTKTLYTDDNGQVSFSMPWDTKYIVETTIKEEVPGTYQGKEYQFIWHCATYCIK